MPNGTSTIAFCRLTPRSPTMSVRIRVAVDGASAQTVGQHRRRALDGHQQRAVDQIEKQQRPRRCDCRRFGGDAATDQLLEAGDGEGLGRQPPLELHSRALPQSSIVKPVGVSRMFPTGTPSRVWMYWRASSRNVSACFGSFFPTASLTPVVGNEPRITRVS